MERFDKLVNPGKLTMLHDSVAHDRVGLFDDLHTMCMKSWFSNMWVFEPIWCTWVQWYGVNDSHELDRCTSSVIQGQFIPHWVNMGISLESDHTLIKDFCLSEKCGYIELQLRRMFGVTDSTETQLLLHGVTSNPLALDRSKELMRYYQRVRYDTVFSRALLQKLM